MSCQKSSKYRSVDVDIFGIAIYAGILRFECRHRLATVATVLQSYVVCLVACLSSYREKAMKALYRARLRVVGRLFIIIIIAEVIFKLY